MSSISVSLSVSLRSGVMSGSGLWRSREDDGLENTSDSKLLAGSLWACGSGGTGGTGGGKASNTAGAVYELPLLDERSRVEDVPSILPRKAVVFALTDDLLGCLDMPPSLIEAIERGLVSTQSELGVPPVPTRSFVLEPGVPAGEAHAAELDEPAVADLWRSRLLPESLDPVGARRFADGELVLVLLLAPASLFLLLRRSVARSGLLAVPGERYIERRFVWRSVSSWAS